MKDICKSAGTRKVRPGVFAGLTFFVCFLFYQCRPASKAEQIRIDWKDKKAVAILISKSMLDRVPADSVDDLVQVRLSSASDPAGIFGSYADAGQDVRFTPLLPFTPGLRYNLWIRGKQSDTFEIPAPDSADAPVVTAIYPSGDTLPENLLKIHLYFSLPMREGQSGKYVSLIKNNRDTVDAAFLDLQPELWNPERTMLTLWLDPGRIKRDLQPNQRMGAPMRAGTRYKIAVSGDWESAEGIKLSSPAEHTFVTAPKDSLSPVPSHWQILVPQAGTRGMLTVRFGKPLDYSLLQEVFIILDASGEAIRGKWQVRQGETQCTFEPHQNWKPGQYRLQIENRLEDLAGNNITRPFDRDVTRGKPAHADQPFTIIPFRVKAVVENGL
nr:Ig-like domain-containing protein [uncultured Dyadobacter sp.]